MFPSHFGPWNPIFCDGSDVSNLYATHPVQYGPVPTNKAENLALISSNWKTPLKAFSRAISGLRVFVMAPINWKRPPSPTRTSKNRIGDHLG